MAISAVVPCLSQRLSQESNTRTDPERFTLLTPIVIGFLLPFLVAIVAGIRAYVLDRREKTRAEAHRAEVLRLQQAEHLEALSAEQQRLRRLAAYICWQLEVEDSTLAVPSPTLAQGVSIPEQILAAEHNCAELREKVQRLNFALAARRREVFDLEQPPTPPPPP